MQITIRSAFRIDFHEPSLTLSLYLSLSLCLSNTTSTTLHTIVKSYSLGQCRVFHSFGGVFPCLSGIRTEIRWKVPTAARKNVESGKKAHNHQTQYNLVDHFSTIHPFFFCDCVSEWVCVRRVFQPIFLFCPSNWIHFAISIYFDFNSNLFLEQKPGIHVHVCRCILTTIHSSFLFALFLSLALSRFLILIHRFHSIKRIIKM